MHENIRALIPALLIVPAAYYGLVMLFRELELSYAVYSYGQPSYTHSGGVLSRLSSYINHQLESRGITGKLDRFLSSAGYPFGLRPVSFLLVSAAFGVISILYGLLAGITGLRLAILPLLAALLPYLLVKYEHKRRESEFRSEMPELVDLFELGATADVPLESAFLAVIDSARSRAVRREFERIAAEYFTTHDKTSCLNRFCERVKLPEASVLSMALLQGDRTGRTREVLASLSSSLYNTTLSKVSRQDKTLEYKVLAAIFLLMASTVMLQVYPYFTVVEGGLRLLF